jgi:hypothetical protein
MDMRDTEGELHPERIDNPEVEHEHSDVNVRAIVSFALALVVVAAVLQVALYGMLRLMEWNALRNDPARHPLATQQPPGPPEPRLQPDPVSDLAKMRAAEEQRLNSYGWVDKEKGVVHIPIEQAMELVVRRGLPKE